MTNKELEARMRELEAENERLRSTPKREATITMKVSQKGAVSVYGLGRFPVTLYGSQWDSLLSHVDELKAFLKAHRGELATK